jgi:hypothetical protein
MTLYDKILAVFPELTEDNFGINKDILLRNDSDGSGDYIALWGYTKPLTEELESFLR